MGTSEKHIQTTPLCQKVAPCRKSRLKKLQLAEKSPLKKLTILSKSPLKKLSRWRDAESYRHFAMKVSPSIFHEGLVGQKNGVQNVT